MFVKENEARDLKQSAEKYSLTPDTVMGGPQITLSCWRHLREVPVINKVIIITN